MITLPLWNNVSIRILINKEKHKNDTFLNIHLAYLQAQFVQNVEERKS